MPRFFIDTDDGTFHAEDAIGRELADAQEARRVACTLLYGIMRSLPPETAQHTFAASVRDARGDVVCVVTLAVTERSLDPT